jgi:UDP-N-acetylmuramoyl-tripeptide--D-alanyl-D-alanine ligase
MNSVAALAVVEALGADLGQAADAFASVGASAGRGARRHLILENGTIELLDESYNANPMSVQAMLAVLSRTSPAGDGRRVLVLGDMRELGDEADRYHADLAGAVAKSGAVEIYLCGPHLRALLRALPASLQAIHRPDSAALAPEVAAALRPGDVVAVKGSLGSKMKLVVDAIMAATGGEAVA